MMLSSIRLLKMASAAGAGLCLTLAGWLATTPLEAAPKPKDERPAFYLTRGTYDGAQAVDACDAGFHMASIGEILDPSGLRYDVTRGHTTADSGGGPPHASFGWIRTGLGPIQSSEAGSAMCIDDGGMPWSSNASTKRGTIVSLSFEFTGAATPISPYGAGVWPCSLPQRAWCVQD